MYNLRWVIAWPNLKHKTFPEDYLSGPLRKTIYYLLLPTETGKASAFKYTVENFETSP